MEDLRQAIAAQRAILDLAEARLDSLSSPPKPPEDDRVTFLQTFDKDGVVGYDPTGSGGLTLEWSGIVPLEISGGVATLTGNRHTNSYQGYHRMLSQDPVHDPKRPVEVRLQAAVDDWSAVSYNGQFAGLKFGMKYPKPEAVTGYPPTDPRSVLGGRGEKNAYTWIGVCGLSPEGRMEIARYNGSGYLKFPSPKFKPYRKGEPRDVVIRVTPESDTRWDWRIWNDKPTTEQPDYAFAGEPPSTPDNLAHHGFLWIRSDAVDVSLISLEVVHL